MRSTWSLAKVLGLTIALLAAPPALAGWSLNIGWHNPPNSTLGINFLYIGSALAFEIGVGALDFGSEDANNTENDDTARAGIYGDVNVKYLFGSSGLRPYVQAGLGAGLAAKVGSDTRGGAGLSGPFGGIGILGDAKSWYAYASYNVAPQQVTFAQVGLGFSFR